MDASRAWTLSSGAQVGSSSSLQADAVLCVYPKARGRIARAGADAMRTGNTMTADNATSETATTPPRGRLRLVGRWVAGLLRTAAGYHAAAATYEQLSHLSDAELQRRGLNRTTLARDVCRDSERRSER
jgi:hypothetical protein